MEETKRTYADDEGEETMVAPRFDDEETVLARPVVPFEEVGDAPAVIPATSSPASATVAPPPYSNPRAAPRRSLVAALVLVSALVGSVLGGAGLYFYQMRKNADEPASQPQAEAPAAQPATETASESQSREPVVPSAAEPPAPSAAETAAETEVEDDDDTAKDRDADESAASPVAERRNVSEDREPAATPKRGKKGARDEEIRREARRAPRHAEDDRPVGRDEISDDDRREARRVGVITYRPRRVRPRRDRYESPDRLRRIFEGQP